MKFLIMPMVFTFTLNCPLAATANTTAQSQDRQWLIEQSALVLEKNSITTNIKGVGDKKILVAGAEKFRVLWTRDFAFAALGAIAVNNLEPVRGGLESLFAYQRADGLFPRRIGDVSNVVRGVLDKLGIPRKPPEELKKPEFKSGLGGTPIDSNPLLAWVLEEYTNKTQDIDFVRSAWPKMDLAFQWMSAREHDGLIVQEPFADWKDVTPRKGKVLYTNVLYYRGLIAMQNLALLLENTEASALYGEKAQVLKQKIQQAFWVEKYGFFQDELGRDESFFSADGNFLAIIFNIADARQSEYILHQADYLLTNKATGLIANVSRPYPNVPMSIRFVRIHGYSDNTYVYPWNTALYIRAARVHASENNSKRIDNAVMALKNSIILHGFQEAYEINGEPVHRWAHKSEPDFTWFAGMLAWALNP